MFCDSLPFKSSTMKMTEASETTTLQNNDLATTVHAADLNLKKEQMIGFMNLVKEGKLTIDEALKRAQSISERQDPVEKEDRYRVDDFGEQMDILSTLPVAVKQSVTKKMRQDRLPFDDALAQVLEATYGKTKRHNSGSSTASRGDRSASMSPATSSSSLRQRMGSLRIRRRSTNSDLEGSTDETSDVKPRRGLLRRKSTSEVAEGQAVSEELNQEMIEASKLLAQLKANKADGSAK
eukprot:TRINITY_DN7649_c1_g1_i1.p1 TRINITY_DN7649_c1_g1~~TRINITY_DN7649_c1_g1_i1.p1  ORF type:complete len:237 (+),score=46.51 TRINITY_DN7649_c1_g1_i1:101-811(+)